ncbi:sulfur carrier protein ThiS [Corticibacter populi]|uniref:Sulfur carrier protein ThiS n=1 Tax=Corticibacter populi TaxID=1550736 RepID=A0A3M6QTS9_9BURK|nr:sulfur carrier protein ThiS [Corticibacter populi]RMX05882.1 sulfur carrier protein ThiS [Corticibacter populi]RZS30799.1 sulfur carrier protein [Corticibacter populi]
MSDSHATLSILLNGKPTQTTAATLLQLIAEMSGHALNEQGQAVDGTRLGIAVAVAGLVVPRGQWHCTAIKAGQQIEVVTAKQGG